MAICDHDMLICTACSASWYSGGLAQLMLTRGQAAVGPKAVTVYVSNVMNIFPTHCDGICHVREIILFDRL